MYLDSKKGHVIHITKPPTAQQEKASIVKNKKAISSKLSKVRHSKEKCSKTTHGYSLLMSIAEWYFSAQRYHS